MYILRNKCMGHTENKLFHKIHQKDVANLFDGTQIKKSREEKQ